MLSESARMSSAAEAKFRIAAPNSRPRAIKVIALDAASERVVKDLARDSWQGATFLTASAFAGAASGSAPERFSLGGWLNDLAGRTKNLVEEVASADLVVIVGRECRRRGHYRRSLRRPSRDDDRADPWHRLLQRRSAVQDAGAVATACDDAGD